ncbi:NADH-quinone oxidoreductase subunit NuoN [Pseudactinotalea sp. Z1748]|uniref:NADH-quinone oxidoreductase subunit NuoN n=1 Tax=Pseudactinotalea sp. Z1748 TaxID=3413027 RepID=UPI003C7CC6BE
MNPFEPPVVQWGGITPVLIVFGAAVLGVLLEGFLPRKVRRVVQVVLAIGALGAALVAVGWRWSVVQATGPSELIGGAVIEDGPALATQAVLLVCALVGVLVMADRAGGEDAFTASASAAPGSRYEALTRTKGLVQTEVFPLTLLAVTGMLVFPSSGTLLTLFIALEVLSLPLYLLAGLARRRRLLSQEAALKYFLLGAFATAFVLMGTALLYGYSGSLRLDEIAAAVPAMAGMDGFLLAGITLVLVGLLFKIGAVPFHNWVPDVYQGAPTPVTGFMAACTKIAALMIMMRLVYVVAPGLAWDLGPMLWAVAIATMVLGTVLALVQSDVKRMLAYSSVAHAGFLLLGVIALDAYAVPAVLFYLLAYGLATVGAFALVTLVRERDADGNVTGEALSMNQWAGLGRTNPWLAASMGLFLLSFAGIPLTGGFIGKFTVFYAAVAGGAWPLVVIAVLASAAAAFFYVRLIVAMFFTDPGPETGRSTVVVPSEGMTVVAVGIAAVGTVLLGVLPGPVLDVLGDAAMFLL